MSTRSTIAFAQADGTVKVFYCHRNGHLRYNGKALMQHFSTHETAAKLEKCGDELGAFFDYGSLADFVQGQERGDITNGYKDKPAMMSLQLYTWGGWQYGQGDVKYAYFWDGEEWQVLVNTEKEVPSGVVFEPLAQILKLLPPTT